MKKLIPAIAIAICCVSIANAQTEADALRYTTPFAGSTARSSSIGGAFGAIGADFSCLSINPAGLGLYRKSEVIFTPSVQSTTKKTTFFANTNLDNATTLNLQNWGVIISSKLGKDDNLPEWKYINFGIGMNRYNILSANTYIEGMNPTSSIGNYFVKNADGYTLNQLNGFQSGLAYDTYFIDPYKDSIHYISLSDSLSLKTQSKAIKSRGSIGETVISLGANYSNKWYFGATIGIAKIIYSEKSTFTEEDSKNQSGNFKKMSYTEDLTTRGNGINLKIGAIYKPADWLRLGIALHSSTSYSLNDVYSVTMTTSFDTSATHTKEADNAGGYQYGLKTPMRIIGSVGFIIGKKGFISIDDEYIDYRNAFLSPSKDFGNVNQQIVNKFTNCHNVKIGGEYNITPFTLRAGYSLFSNPYNANFNTNVARSNYSVGLGFKANSFFFDFAFVYSDTKPDRYYLYDLDKLPSTKIISQRSTLLSTIGFKF